MNTFDFSRSYLRFRIDRLVQPAITVTHVMPTTVNNVRINVECRCELLDRRTGRAQQYVLGASCKTERVGVDRDVWLQPNADFCLIASEEEFLVIKSWAKNGMVLVRHPEADGTPLERQSGNSRDAWAELSLQMRPARGEALLEVDAVIDAIRNDRPLVSHTEFDDGPWHVTIDHPVKTINYSERERIYQTDTGPILFPDLSPERLAGCERLVQCFDLAYSAFNSKDWAEFIVNVPTPAGEGISVNHYSRPRRIAPVRNRLIEVLEESRPAHHLGEAIERGQAYSAHKAVAK